MHADVGQFPALKKWAWLLATLSFLVVLSSVVLRVDAGYPSCAGNPGCVMGGTLGLWGWQLPVAAIRAIHRVTASAALVLAIFFAWKFRHSSLSRDGMALVLLMLFLAVVGVTGSGPDAVWGRFANILGGLGLLSLSGRMVLAMPTPAAASSGTANYVLRAGLVALAATYVLGASIGARFAAAACTSLPDCAGTWWPTADGWAVLDPRRLLSPASLPGDSAAVGLHLLHRYCAGAAFLLLGFAGIRGLRQKGTRAASLSLLALLIMEVVLGGLTVTTDTNLWPMVGHALISGLLLVGVHWLGNAERRVASTDFPARSARKDCG